jgi:hypothetical protein
MVQSPSSDLFSPRRVQLAAITQLPVSENSQSAVTVSKGSELLQKAVTVSDVFIRKHKRLVTVSLPDMVGKHSMT